MYQCVPLWTPVQPWHLALHVEVAKCLRRVTFKVSTRAIVVSYVSIEDNKKNRYRCILCVARPKTNFQKRGQTLQSFRGACFFRSL